MAGAKGGSGMLTKYVLLVALALSGSITRPLYVRAQLSQSYYATTCPNVESIARQAFLNRVSFFNIISLPANILRLAFHDCAVDGCEGSVLLSSSPDGTITDEKNSFKNIGIGNLDVISYMKQQIDAQCSDTLGNPVVSCADTLALAGREAFNFAKGVGNLGSQIIPIGLGRRDGVTAQTSHADAQLLGPDTSVDTLIANFGRFGLTIEQIVALIGSHTIGISHCTNIVNRLYPTTDATLSQPQNIAFATSLEARCPQNFNPSAFVNNDATNTIFDNTYFTNVMMGQGLLTVDNNLQGDARTAPFVQNFALNQPHFFDTFGVAYGILTSGGALTGTQGEIRKDCSRPN